MILIATRIEAVDCVPVEIAVRLYFAATGSVFTVSRQQWILPIVFAGSKFNADSREHDGAFSASTERTACRTAVTLLTGLGSGL